MSKKILRILIPLAFAAFPMNASALVLTGFLAGPVAPLNAGDILQANAVADPFENFNNVSGSFTAAENLHAIVTTTMNPFLTAIGGNGLSNSIVIDYQINSGALFGVPLTQTNMTGSGFIPPLTLNAGDQVTFFINGLAGRSGNDVDFNVSTSAIPLPPALAFLLTGLAGFAFVSSRRNKASTMSS